VSQQQQSHHMQSAFRWVFLWKNCHCQAGCEFFSHSPPARTHTLSHTLAGGYILVHHTIDGWLFLRAGYRERGGLPACPLACLLARLAGWRLYAAIALCAHYAARRVCINVHIPANTYSPVQSYVPRLCSVCVCPPTMFSYILFYIERGERRKREREPRGANKKYRGG
jgi:hypothetical protein